MKYCTHSILVFAIALLSGEDKFCANGFTQPQAQIHLGAVSPMGHHLSPVRESSLLSSPVYGSFSATATTTARKGTKLQMSSPAAGFGAIAGAVSGGVLGGALHAIAGELLSY